MSGSSSSNPGEEYQYPNFVTVKLTGRDMYDAWKTQMLCLLESHDMLHFIMPSQNMGVLWKEKDSMWRRSDALVKGWILGSLSKQTLKCVVNLLKPNTDSTAKYVWDKLQTIYGPPQTSAGAEDCESQAEEERIRTADSKTVYIETKDEDRFRNKAAEKLKGELYEAVLSQNFQHVVGVLNGKLEILRDTITINGETALHVAVGTTKNREFLEEIFNLATQDNRPLDMRNSEGSTLLHVAAIVGNIEAAKILVRINHDLMNATDNEGQTPLARALTNMHTKMYMYLLYTDVGYLDIEMGRSTRCELLVNIISSKDYGSAWSLFYNYDVDSMMYIDTTVLMAIAQNFPSKLNFWERTVHKCASQLKFKSFEATETTEVNYRLAKTLLREICSRIEYATESKLHHDYYKNAILEASRQNSYEVVKVIVSVFPNAIWSVNEDGHNIIQCAVVNRSDKVYNLLYQMSEHKNIYRTVKDPFRNNLLHLAARLAAPEKLSHISGVALQIQHELQWFKEVERFVCPLNLMQQNWCGLTPQMVFTREHKELVTEGGKWMKDTAQSYTITAALIITIVYAAAITVPGGNRQDNGIPVFTNKTAFTVFAFADAISLFTSVTSLLMFLSILTARFNEQDFLFKLPTKLIIGLATLFISTTAMLVAFGASLFLMFCQNNPQILIPIATLICLPITSFMSSQFPLIYDLMSATYGRSMFGKKSDSPFY